MKKIVIASGKGGTGKTTVAVNLAYYLSTHLRHRVRLLDCDVEVPNSNLFLRAGITRTIPVTVPRPVWEPARCNSSRNCVSVCNYNAIAKVKDRVLIFDDLCHSCGACVYFCPENALRPGKAGIGKIELAEDHIPFSFGQGVLNIGESLAPRVIRKLKEHMDDGGAINLLDAPPGTGCPVVKTMEGMDYCLLVTEPTPFGLNDLTLAAALAAKLGVPAGIVINRSHGRDRIIEDFGERHHIPIVGKIPFRKEYAESYSRGDILLEHHPELVDIFSGIHREMNQMPRLPAIEIKWEDDIGGDDVFEPPAEAKDIPQRPCREIAVISGKGGTGKTTITAALTFLMENKVLADSDVDASNLHLLCNPERFHARDFIGGQIFAIDQDACIACGECADQCRFGAISLTDRDGDIRVEIDELSCEGCGFCYYLCPNEAIFNKEAISGKWCLSRTGDSFLSVTSFEIRGTSPHDQAWVPDGAHGRS
ncbi:MAG: MinD superfamily P-loop ATPase, contains an inserted ferredoxin domain [Candidatus Kentron sp. G]|nr:MAG: MinD superfamily P-loop ATPase, contains an inserted ferredoxin domain [Candidatus Kentron sp. G]